MAGEQFMQRCFQLAKKGKQSVAPNPLVGCVITSQVDGDEVIIGEGYHTAYGEAHAEVQAIKSVRDKSLLSSARLYVSLEPCSHYGKTPPCADLIIEKGIPEVIVAMKDPNPQVAGRGIQRLREAGISVEFGLLEKEANWLNRAFVVQHQQQMPYTILKWAESADGFMAPRPLRKYWISNQQSRQVVHKLRSSVQAIMIGSTTAITDTPLLNTREWSGNSPARLLLDPDLKCLDYIEQSKNLKSPLLVFNTHKSASEESVSFIKLEVVNVLSGLKKELYERNIQSLLVEGGAHTLQSFIDENQWHEMRVFKGQEKLNDGLKAPVHSLKADRSTNLFGDEIEYFYNKKTLPAI